MSFQQRKQIADLKAENNALFQKRFQLLVEKKKSAILTMRDSAIYFLNQQGFSINKLNLVNKPHIIEADYKGEMNITITFSQADESFLGADITIDVTYLNKEFGFAINLTRETFQSIDESDLVAAITAHQALNEKLLELDGSDIDGSYKISLWGQADVIQTFNSIEDVLKFVLEME